MATAKTQLQIVNNLLLRLRETEVVSTTDNSYSTLLAQIVADSYEEVADEWNWLSMEQVAYIPLPAGSLSIVADSTTVGTIPTWEMFLERERGHTRARIFPDGTPPFPLEQGVGIGEATLANLEDERLRVGDQSIDTTPTCFAVKEYLAGTGVDDATVGFEFLQSSTTDYTFCLQFRARPLQLTTDGTLENEPLLIPTRPVQELAMMYALNERGEEMGEPGNVAEARYIRALAAAKEKDLKAGEYTNVYDWERD